MRAEERASVEATEWSCARTSSEEILADCDRTSENLCAQTVKAFLSTNEILICSQVFAPAELTFDLKGASSLKFRQND